MSRKITVAGAGHGGLVAAYYLAKEGFDVTVYEQKEKAYLGYDQTDSVHIDGFEDAGIPVPEQYKVRRTPLSFIIPDTELPPITQGVGDDSYNVEINRKALYDHLIDLACGAGAKIEYGTSVEGPIMLGSRVAGIKTSKGEVYSDLVIDACGLSSSVRRGLPDFTLTDRDAERKDVLTAFRGYFERVEGSPEPELKYKVYLVPGKHAGLMWTIAHPYSVDVLIGSFEELTEEEITEKLDYLKSVNPQLGERLLRGGKCHDIPVRQPMSVLVADGYAAVGDCAFMTIPVKGSGVGYSMRAGKILAECVIKDENGLYNRETLWNYQYEFFNKIGFDGALLAIVRNLITVISREDIEYIFSSGILSPETLQKFGNEEGMLKILTSMKFSQARDLTKKIAGHQELRKIILSTAKNIARYTMLKQNLKNKYDSKSLEKWVRSYNRFFASLSDSDNETEEEE